MRRLNAKRTTIPPHAFFSQHEIDPEKVAGIVAHLQSGGTVPPVVAVQYGDEHMPIDGHHRLCAFQELERTADAWIVPGSKFETLDRLCQMDGTGKRAEDCIFCDGVSALEVAKRWKP